TQVAEVKRVQEVLESGINSAGDQQKQVAEYARILVPFSISNQQRENLLALRTHLVSDQAVVALKKQLMDGVEQARNLMEKDKKLKFPDARAAAMRTRRGELARPFEEGVGKLIADKIPADRKTQLDVSVLDQPVNQVVASQHAALKAQFDEMFRDALEWE